MTLVLNIPKIWRCVSLPDITILNMGQSPSSSDVNSEGKGVVFFQGKAEFGKLHPVAKKYCTAPKKIAEKNDILLSVRAPVGPTNLANQTTAIGRGLAALRPYCGVNYKYLLYFFRAIEPWLSEQGTGSTFKAVSGQFLKQLPVTIAPLPEQKQIAAKLDELLAQVDSIKTRLDAIPAILKRFRQSVLAAAVSGRLTEEWRETSDISCWVKANIGSIATVGTGKTPKRSNNKYWDNGTIPWLTSASTGQIFCLNAKQHVTEHAVKDCMLKVFQPGTLLLAMYGEGKTRGQVTELKLAATCNQACAAITVDDKNVLRDFVKIRLRENYEETRKAAAGGAQPNLNLNKVREIPILIPPMKEQTQITQRVEQLFAFAEQIEQRLTTARARVDHLTQSILAKAFRGELTAQWRAQNPDLISGEHSAAALLEKIKAARKAAPTKRTRKKS